ncbi:beta-ACP synthase, partial [Amaricoccus sp. HAR-UPW-R2A-40]
MAGRRVVITGHGAISALGMTAAENRASMREGRCAIGPMQFEDVDRLSISIGGQI